MRDKEGSVNVGEVARAREEGAGGGIVECSFEMRRGKREMGAEVDAKI